MRTHLRTRSLSIALLPLLWACSATPPGISVAPAASLPHSSLVYQAVARMDDAMTRAFNAHDVRTLMSLFAPDLEFYHDAAGMQSYAMVADGFTNLLSRNDGMRRELVPGTLEVFPIKGYGAVEVGEHKFCHEENGRTVCGTFKFLQIWRAKGDHWQMTRVVSYAH